MENNISADAVARKLVMLLRTFVESVGVLDLSAPDALVIVTERLRVARRAQSDPRVVAFIDAALALCAPAFDANKPVNLGRDDTPNV